MYREYVWAVGERITKHEYTNKQLVGEEVGAGW